MKKYVLYNSTDDGVICNKDYKTLLFDSYEEAEENWTGHPEEVILFEQLPLHHQEHILNEIQ
jgi:hypothetical protein